MGQDISVRDKLLEKGCSLRVARNRMDSIFRPNKEYKKQSRVKTIKEALLGGPGY